MTYNQMMRAARKAIIKATLAFNAAKPRTKAAREVRTDLRIEDATARRRIL